MSCDCIRLTNDALARRGMNTELVEQWMFDGETGATRVTVSIEKRLLQKRPGERAKTIIPTFCPFCGERYAPESAAETPA